jgi:prepilin-type processing-associated H-X9-DG protein
LIELLVVVAIISLLVSILLPSLTRAKELTRAVLCSSHLHQIDLGIRFYVEDNDGRIPIPVNCDASAYPSGGWWCSVGGNPSVWQPLMPYLGHDGLVGPPLSGGGVSGRCPTQRQFHDFWVSYGMNLRMFTWSAGNWTPLKPVDELRPDLYFISDALSPMITLGTYGYSDYRYAWNYDELGGGIRMGFWHARGGAENQGAANYLFIGGHVEMTSRETFAENQAAYFVP